MATAMDTDEPNKINIQQNKVNIQPTLSKQERKLQLKLRDSGLSYISRTGKIIPAKKQPDILCNCPQKCDEKVPLEARKRLFKEFYGMADHMKQNDFLIAHIEMRAVQRRPSEMKIYKRSKRRVSCKYKIPCLRSTDPSIKPGPSPEGIALAEVCQKAFMHVYDITEKRVRLQREKLVSELEDSLFPSSMSSENDQQMDLIDFINVPQPAMPVSQSDFIKNLTKDIALVDTFFMNQLWKPEYLKIKT